jgi:hypothetical protein
VKITYEEKRFNRVGQSVLDTSDAICDEYARQGYRLTLRGLYYQLVRRDLFPDAWIDPVLQTKNHQGNYDKLGKLISNGRIAGKIDWAHITDTTRVPSGGDGGYANPAQIVETTADGYYIPKWTGQPEYVEVWVEKEALADVIQQAANRWDVGSLACKGYLSQSAMHDAAQRFRRMERAGKTCTIIHLGDHDPSGIDMTRDIQDRMALFRSGVKVDRIALNMDQITDDLPPSPAKITDSRSSDYIEQFGEDSWELDALEPAVLDGLIERAILEHLDTDMREARIAQEEQDKLVLRALSENWDAVSAYLHDNGYVED